MTKNSVLKMGDIKKKVVWDSSKVKLTKVTKGYKSNYFHVLYLTYLDSHTYIEVSRQFLFSTNNMDIINTCYKHEMNI